MKIKLSRKQWDQIGRKTGWIKNAQMFSNFETLELGPTPSGEECSQVGYADHIDLNRMEVEAFRNQCMRMFPNMPQGARYTRVRNEHEFGTYYELGIKFDENDEAAVEFSYNVENNTPEQWDAQAKSELQQKGYFQRLEQNKKEKRPLPSDPNSISPWKD